LEPRKTGQFGQGGTDFSLKSSIESRDVHIIEDNYDHGKDNIRNKAKALIIEENRVTSSPESVDEKVVIKNTLVTV
jgi:hypothetical protein